jgi:hypothetical protein
MQFELISCVIDDRGFKVFESYGEMFLHIFIIEIGPTTTMGLHGLV